MAICCVTPIASPIMKQKIPVHIHRESIVDPIVDPDVGENPARGQCEDDGKDVEVAASAGDDGCHFG